MEDGPTGLKRETLIGALGLFALCAVLALWLALGRPPYGFYSMMKLLISGSAACAVYILWKFGLKYLPLCVALSGVGYIHLFGNMHRWQWKPYNWAAVIVFAITTVVVGFHLSWRKKGAR